MFTVSVLFQCKTVHQAGGAKDSDNISIPVRVSLASCEVYKKLVAFVMSYSFTDEGAGLLGRTMMVPFVDLLNHSSQHHVELTFHPSCLKLVAVRNISEV